MLDVHRCFGFMHAHVELLLAGEQDPKGRWLVRAFKPAATGNKRVGPPTDPTSFRPQPSNHLN